MSYWDTFREAWVGYAQYLGREVLHPHGHNYLYWLIGLSLAVYALELVRPWRREQPRMRRDFWLDTFYMFWNFFLFPMLIFIGVSEVVRQGFGDLLGTVGADRPTLLAVDTWPVWVQLLTMFVLRDFIHWNVHRLLHRVPFLWELHKVHHSVVEMGYAAHLRYHWGETVAYRSLEAIPLAVIGFGVEDFIVVHLAALLIGHLNHANFRLPVGPLGYVFNNAPMHIWHHARELPPQRKYGVNFGISLSLWDYLFGTAYVPRDGRDIELGFPDLESHPRDFWGQVRIPPRRRSS